MAHDDHEHPHAAEEQAWWKPHSHDSADKVDRALESSEAGIRAVKVSLLALLVTAALQFAIYSLSGSVALLSDTLHNVGDALTAFPLWLAFSLSRRRPTRRFTYGYGRAEDLAGIAIVLVVAVSAVFAAIQTIDRFIDPQGIDYVGLVIAASLIGAAGNELVALYRIRVGREIGSAALVADGMHARVDGLTSLAVFFGALGVAAGFELADPIAGAVVTVAILFILKDAGRDVYLRLMDAVDPELVVQIEGLIEGVPGVERVDHVRVRWIGHRLRAEVELSVDPKLSVVEAHDIGEAAHHRLLHDVPSLASAMVHVDPGGDTDHHASTAHHFTERRN